MENAPTVGSARSISPQRSDPPGHVAMPSTPAASSELGLAASHNLEKGLRATVTWYLEHQPWCASVQARPLRRHGHPTRAATSRSSCGPAGRLPQGRRRAGRNHRSPPWESAGSPCREIPKHQHRRHETQRAPPPFGSLGAEGRFSETTPYDLASGCRLRAALPAPRARGSRRTCPALSTQLPGSCTPPCLRAQELSGGGGQACRHHHPRTHGRPHFTPALHRLRSRGPAADLHRQRHRGTRRMCG